MYFLGKPIDKRNCHTNPNLVNWRGRISSSMEQYAATDPAVCIEIVRAAAELMGCHRYDFIQSSNQDEHLFFVNGRLLKLFTRFAEKNATPRDREMRKRVKRHHDEMLRKETFRKKAKQEQKHERFQQWRKDHGYTYIPLVTAFPTREDETSGLMTTMAAATSSSAASRGAAQGEEPVPSTFRGFEKQESERISVIGSGDEIPDPRSEDTEMEVRR